MSAPELEHCARSWASVLDPERAAAALAVGRDVAGRVADPRRLEAAIADAPHQSAFPDVMGWDACGVAQGDAGLAVMCAYLDACFPEENWDVTGHHFLTSAARTAEVRQGLLPGLFSGLSGLTFATWSLARRGTRYGRLLTALEQALFPQATQLAQAARGRRDGVSVGEFDVISGLSGVGAYMLLRRERREAREVLEDILGALIELTELDAGLPRWRTPPELMADEAMAQQFPDGCLNCGLAHGIPGPLSLMALASREGIELTGQVDAMRRTCDWLVAHRADDEWGVNWATALPVAPSPADGDRASASPSRAAWCYGSPGVARALWLAGSALADPALNALAVEAMEAVHRRPIPERYIDSPTFCHGVAGLAQITLRFAHDTGLPAFVDAVDALVSQLLNAYEPDNVLGFRSVEPGGTRVDQAGLLDGAPGVAVVLLATATGVEPAWDRLFLLS